MVNLLKNLREGIFLLKNHPTFLVPLFVFVILQEIYSMMTKGASNEILNGIGQNFGQQFFTYINKNNSKKGIIANFSTLLAQLSFLGLGEFKVVRHMKNKFVVVKNMDNPIAKQYRKSFGPQKSGIDFFILGLLQGAFSEMTGKSATGKEISCICQNKLNCVYEIHVAKDTKKNFAVPLDLKKLYIGQFYSYNNFIKKILKTGQCTLMNGQLRVWSIYCLNLPFPLIEIFSIETGKIAKDIDKIIEYLGNIQTQRAIAFQRDKFGVKDNTRNLNNLFNQQEMILGMFGKIILEDNSMRIILTRCIPFEQQVKLKGKGKNFEAPYTISLVKNLVYGILNREIKDVSLKIKGNKLKEIILTIEKSTTKSLKTLKSEINDNYRYIIDEKTKHKYFLS